MKIGLVTLGCSKNQVDSEMLLGLFKKRGDLIVNDPYDAEVIVVNTCGFIESAKKEAIDTILEMADYKECGNCNTLIVTGCLAKRYKKDILKNMPEVDLCIGVDEYEHIDNILSEYFNQKSLGRNLEFKNRIIASNFPSCYIRISDGCDNRCSYCAIPLIRGKFKSRKMEDILDEVKWLASKGMREFCIISQDTSKYGIDIYGKLMLPELLREISKIDGVKWIRVLYMYLYEATDELIDEMATNEKVCKYFDIPIQHLSDKILKSMNRHDTQKIIFDRINKIREKVPNAILRTTVMTGFPGETDEDFEILRNGILKLEFDRLGAFAYSKEEETKSYDFKNQIEDSVKQERLKDIFDIQKSISYNLNKKKMNNIYEVLVEGITEDENYFSCRSYMEAPDVDGRIYIKIDEKSSKKVIVGEFIKVRIIDYDDYDLYAQVM